MLNNNVKYAYGQEIAPSIDNVEDLICSDGLPPLSNSTCPDGLAPQPRLANTTAEGLPFQPPETSPGEQLSAGDNATTSEEIQMDINGDGIVDEFESQNQTEVTGSMPVEEIQMDINGDGIVDEFESQNQTEVTTSGDSSQGILTNCFALTNGSCPTAEKTEPNGGGFVCLEIQAVCSLSPNLN